MAPPQRVRVLRCCRCLLFQAHQVKKSLKWTCKACGEKQSFLRAFGEGSGADCRRHVQKLNLLQGQVSELSLRSLEESINTDEEEDADPLQAMHASLQEKPQPSNSRWLKYLQSDTKDLGLEEGGTPSATTGTPDPPFSTGLPRKRRWGQRTVQPPSCPDVQDSGNWEITLEPLKDHTGLAGKVKEGSTCEDWDTRELTIPRGEPARPARQNGYKVIFLL
uniref:MRN complex interacting protein n=1 Tax=Catagonus wagneri TaxID=51154 RepID=A0A8C3VDD0_9CETA